MRKIKKHILIICLILTLIIVYSNQTFAAVEFDTGQPSQIRELILKQKQEKKRLLIEKHKKEQEEQKEKFASTKGKITTSQKPSTSLIKLQSALVIGLFLLTILAITSGFVINYRRQNK